MKTRKGYTLTADQARRRQELAHYITPGPGYRRDIRGDLASLEYAENSAQVECWLDQADCKTYDFR
ncbi:hypothetical protein [Paenarthrobacter sp. NPDC018779]|uniref:hypothetical protein n=1 Tax=Paenarthrobacter sp. NPDC018779 TaxID=3364375 RepID=UPI0037CC1B15